MNDLVQIKKVSKSDLKSFLTQDHTSFSVLSVSTKHIESTNRISVTLSKNSAQSFYLDKKPKTILNLDQAKPAVKDDCLTDAQNCVYFSFFNSKEREKIQADITNLTNKPNKFPQEQTELEKLKDKLKDLEQKDKNTTTQPTKDSKFNPWYVIVPVDLVVVLVISLIIFRKNKKTIQ